MVKEALHERANLLEIAPHLSFPLPIMLPVYHWWQVVHGSSVLCCGSDHFYMDPDSGFQFDTAADPDQDPEV
jgi:glycerol-3-phosphate dehydrogenase